MSVLGLGGAALLAATNAPHHGAHMAPRAVGVVAPPVLADVLPAFDNHPDTDTVRVEDGGQSWLFHIARKAGRYVGAAVEAEAPGGYGGPIRVLVGVTAGEAVQQVRIVDQHETPSIGGKVMDPPFRSQFAGRLLQTTKWSLRKDGGDIDAITGATISSRAATEAVAKAVAVYQRHAAEIRGAPARPGAAEPAASNAPVHRAAPER